jgi:hypothetical protein
VTLCDNLALADRIRPSSNAASTTVAAAPTVAQSQWEFLLLRVNRI